MLGLINILSGKDPPIKLRCNLSFHSLLYTMLKEVLKNFKALKFRSISHNFAILQIIFLKSCAGKFRILFNSVYYYQILRKLNCMSEQHIDHSTKCIHFSSKMILILCSCFYLSFEEYVYFDSLISYHLKFSD